MFETPQAPASEKKYNAFIELVCKREYRNELERVLDKKGRLSQFKLTQHFAAALSDVLAKEEFWARYPNLQRVTTQDITAGNRKISTLLVT